ncbi:hypothetical protein [Synechococcus sp. MIT S9220]
MKVYYLMMAMALGGLPVNAQLDQQWKQRDAEFANCRQRYEDAQYSGGGSNWLIDKQNNIFSLSNETPQVNLSFLSGSDKGPKAVMRCFDHHMAVLNKQKRSGDYECLYKVESNELVRYCKRDGLSEVTREVLGRNRNRPVH